MLLFCDDTPTGKWSERHANVERILNSYGIDQNTIVSIPGDITDKAQHSSGTSTPALTDSEKGKTPLTTTSPNQIELSQGEMLEIARAQIVQPPTLKHILHVLSSPQTLFHCATYFCSFGGELAINSYLGAYYFRNFPSLGQTGSGRWASMFGLLNVITRPLGGIIGDVIYKYTSSVWAKKAWIIFVGVVSGAFLIAIGLTDPRQESLMFGLVAGMAVFLEAGNGANFALVPHVHPAANGVLSGIVGAAGNFGGVCFAVLFRFHGTRYEESLWIAGVMIVGMNLVLCWVKPLPKGKDGVR